MRSGFGLKPALIALLAVALLPAGGLAIGQAVRNFYKSRDLRDEAFLARLGDYAAEETALLAETRSVLRFVAPEVGESRADQAACNALMDRLKATSPRFVEASFTNLEGYVICGTGGFSEPVYVGDHKRFENSAARLSSQIDVVFGRSTEQQIILVLEPVYEGSEFVGDVSVSIPVESFDRLAKLSDDDAVARVAVFSGGVGDGVRVAEDFGSDNAWLPDSGALTSLASAAPVVRPFAARSGDDYVYASAEIAPKLFVVAAWPMAQVTYDLRTNAALSLGLPVLTWALASVIAYIAIDRLVLTHVRRLTRLTGTLRRGDLAARADLPQNAPLEFAELGDQFDSMAQRLEEREARLRRAIEDERMLLREVYHRVKNNLQLIVSLLNLQARQAEDETELAVIRQTQDRVQSLAMVHQNLYQVGRLSEARLDTILEQIVAAIRSMRGGDHGNVDVKLAFEPVRIDADRAVPASLLATEALTNAFKHAWPADEPGSLSLELRAVDGGGFELTIANDLSARRPETTTETGKGIGESLIRGFARQLRAELEMGESDGWYRVKVIAPPPRRIDESDDAGEVEPPATLRRASVV